MRYLGYFHNRRDDLPEETNAWLITFTDTMALMLTFFVLTFAMSNPRVEQWEGMTDTIRDNFNRFYGADLNRGDQDTINIGRIDFDEALELSYLEEVLQTLLKEQPELSSLVLNRLEHSLVLSLPQNLLFERDAAQVSEKGRRALYTIAASLRRVKNRIEIAGHTDPQEPSVPAYPTNWDLSLARAAAVSATMETAGYDKPVAIFGAASGRYEDLEGVVPEEERLALSRRVDIVIMEDDGKQVTVFDIPRP